MYIARQAGLHGGQTGSVHDSTQCHQGSYYDDLAASLDRLFCVLSELEMVLEKRMAGASGIDKAQSARPRAEKQEISHQVRSAPSPEERARLISEAAYFRAEKRNFAPSNPVEDWRAAEAEIDARFASQSGTLHR